MSCVSELEIQNSTKFGKPKWRIKSSPTKNRRKWASGKEEVANGNQKNTTNPQQAEIHPFRKGRSVFGAFGVCWWLFFCAVFRVILVAATVFVGVSVCVSVHKVRSSIFRSRQQCVLFIKFWNNNNKTTSATTTTITTTTKAATSAGNSTAKRVDW